MSTSLNTYEEGGWTTISGICGLMLVHTRMFRPRTIKAEPKIGRNDDCPCWSGKKYKHCHGARS